MGSWVAVECFFSAVCSAVLLLYLVLRIAASVVRGGWVDRFVGVHGFVFFFLCFFFPLSCPRAGIFRRTTNNVITV